MGSFLMPLQKGDIVEYESKGVMAWHAIPLAPDDSYEIISSGFYVVIESGNADLDRTILAEVVLLGPDGRFFETDGDTLLWDSYWRTAQRLAACESEPDVLQHELSTGTVPEVNCKSCDDEG